MDLWKGPGCVLKCPKMTVYESGNVSGGRDVRAITRSTLFWPASLSLNPKASPAQPWARDGPARSQNGSCSLTVDMGDHCARAGGPSSPANVGAQHGPGRSHGRTHPPWAPPGCCQHEVRPVWQACGAGSSARTAACLLLLLYCCRTTSAGCSCLAGRQAAATLVAAVACSHHQCCCQWHS